MQSLPSQLLVRWFPLWAALLSGVALLLPAPFVALQAAIVPLLALVMLGMGLTLQPADFRGVVTAPRLVATGVLLQYTVMPVGAFLVSRLLSLPAEQTVGMVLVGAASGGTASNVIAFLAGGNVALSIAMTAVSTLLAILLMPAWTAVLVGRAVEVPAVGMMQTIATVALGPVMIGMALRRALGQHVQRFEGFFPAVSVSAICLIIAVIAAINRPGLEQVAPLLGLAVVLHNGLGLAGGYLAARLLGAGLRDARTIAIEVGMQNSGLAVALALKLFSPAAALPGALFSLWHNVSGSVLAGYWAGKRRRGQLAD